MPPVNRAASQNGHAEEPHSAGEVIRLDSGRHPVAGTDAPPISQAAYQAALNSLPPSLRPWLILAVVVFSGGGLANLYALWEAPAQIKETRQEVAELREVVCLLANKEGIEADACRYRR